LDLDVSQKIDFLSSSAIDRPSEHSEIKENETLQSIRPLPKAPPCKNTGRGQKIGKNNYFN